MGAVGGATALVAGGHSLFSRMRWTRSGTTVEDIEYFNTCSEMFHRLLPREKQSNIELMGFAGGVVPADGTRTLLFRPSILGICNQPLWIPPFMGHQGCVIEMHLAMPDQLLQSGVNQSSSYYLSNVRALCDVFTLDAGLSNTYASHEFAAMC